MSAGSPTVAEKPSPISLSRPKRAAATATDLKIQAALASEVAKLPDDSVLLPSKKAKKAAALPPSLRLTYLDIKGAAEPIRLALFIGGLAFDDVRITYDEVARRRKAGTLPFGQVPTLEIDGVTHAQSLALLRWAGRRAGLCADAEGTQLRCDAVHEALSDIDGVLKPQWYGHVLGRSPISGAKLVPMSDEQKEEAAKLLNEEVVPARLAHLEKVRARASLRDMCSEKDLT